MSDTPSIFTQLDKWYQQPLGQALSATIIEQLQPILANLFGYHLLQLGIPDRPEWVASSPIPHKICLLPELLTAPATGVDNLFGDFDALPLASSSIDVVVLPHILAFMKDPMAVMAEVDRVLVPEGHVVIIGFNPLSLWGFGRLWMQFTHHQAPWCGKFMSTYALRSHLNQFSFEVLELTSFFFRPPVHNPQHLERLLFLEALGRISWPYPGGAYVLLARKQVARLTKIKPIWRFRNIVIGKRFVQPTTINRR